LGPIKREGAEKNAKLWPAPVADAACWFVQSRREFYYYNEAEFWKFSLDSRTWADLGEATKIKSVPTDAISTPGPIVSARLSWVDDIGQVLYFFGGNGASLDPIFHPQPFKCLTPVAGFYT
jgi:hypothetical protein